MPNGAVLQVERLLAVWLNTITSEVLIVIECLLAARLNAFSLKIRLKSVKIGVKAVRLKQVNAQFKNTISQQRSHFL